MKEFFLVWILVASFTWQPQVDALMQLTEEQQAEFSDSLDRATIIVDPGIDWQIAEEVVSDWAHLYTMLRLHNGQLEIVEELADSFDDKIKARLTRWLAVAHLRELADQFDGPSVESVRNIDCVESIEQIQALVKQQYEQNKSTPSPHFTKQISRLISAGQTDLVVDLIYGLSDKLADQRLEHGDVLVSFQLHQLANVASAHMRQGDEVAANAIVDSLGAMEARDRIRLRLFCDRIRHDGVSQQSTNEILEQLQTPKSQFLANLNKAESAISERDPKAAMECVARIEAIYVDLPDYSQRNYCELLLGLVKLQLECCVPCRETLNRAIEIGAEIRFLDQSVMAVSAMAGRFDRVNQPSNVVFETLQTLLDTGLLRSGIIVELKPKLTKIEKRKTAMALIRHIKNDNFRAGLLAMAAKAVSKTDPVETLELTNEAYELSRGTSHAAAPMTNYDRNWSMEQIARAYLACDRADLAFDAAQFVTDQTNSYGGPITEHQKSRRAVLVAAIKRSYWRNDRLFRENDGQAIFDLLESLDKQSQLDSDIHDIADAIGKFAELGEWEKAERMLKICQSEFVYPFATSKSLSRQMVVQGVPAERIQSVWSIYRRLVRPGFLKELCLQFGRHKEKPSIEVVNAISQMARELDDSGKLRLDVVTFLIAGFWMYDREFQADEWIRWIEEKEQATGWLTEQLNSPGTWAQRLISEAERSLSTKGWQSPFNQYSQRLTVLFWQCCGDVGLRDIDLSFRLGFEIGTSVGRSGSIDEELMAWVAKQSEQMQAVFYLGKASGLLEASGTNPRLYY